MSNKELLLQIESFQYKDSLSFFMICYALSESKKHSLVINFYERFKNNIKESGNEIIGLQTIISICKEKNDTILYNKYLLQLQKKSLKDNSFLN